MAQKVSLYAVNDLKNATDDALAPYLTHLPPPYTFTQQHTHTNVRLALGYTAVAIAGLLFYADWKLGWDATKIYTLPACVAYFILNAGLSYWIWAVERGAVFVGRREGGQTLTLRSSAQKHKPFYTLKVRFEPGSRSTTWEDSEIQGTFMEWFDAEGVLQHARLKSWLARNIEVVGRADPESRGRRTFDGGEGEGTGTGGVVGDGDGAAGGDAGADTIMVDYQARSDVGAGAADLGTPAKARRGRPRKA